MKDEYSLQELLADLNEEEEVIDPGDNYLTPTQWAKRWGISLGHARQAIARLMKAGKMGRRQRTQVRINGSNYPQPVYGIIDKDEQL